MRAGESFLLIFELDFDAFILEKILDPLCFGDLGDGGGGRAFIGE
jgi:hypothetical protein